MKKKLFAKIYDSCTPVRWFIIAIVTVVVYLSVILGTILWIIIRPLSALSHLLMMHPHTAWESLIDINPSYSLRDVNF